MSAKIFSYILILSACGLFDIHFQNCRNFPLFHGHILLILSDYDCPPLHWQPQ